jgi:hypothetical protein
MKQNSTINTDNRPYEDENKDVSSLDAKNNNGNDDEQSFKEKLSVWFERSKMHGFSNIVLASNMGLQIFWIMVFSACFVYCLYLIIMSTKEYYKYATAVSISQVVDSPADFPAVTICNLNPFNEQRAFTDINAIASKCPCVSDPSSYVNLSNITYSQMCTSTNSVYAFFSYLIKKLKRSISNSNFTHEDYKKIGFTYEDMVSGNYLESDLFSWFEIIL